MTEETLRFTARMIRSRGPSDFYTHLTSFAVHRCDAPCSLAIQ